MPGRFVHVKREKYPMVEYYGLIGKISRAAEWNHRHSHFQCGYPRHKNYSVSWGLNPPR